jgi:hypothetical protein
MGRELSYSVKGTDCFQNQPQDVQLLQADLPEEQLPQSLPPLTPLTFIEVNLWAIFLLEHSGHTCRSLALILQKTVNLCPQS